MKILKKLHNYTLKTTDKLCLKLKLVTIYSDLFSDVYSDIYSQVQNESTAKVLTEEVFTQLLLKIKTSPEITNIETWLQSLKMSLLHRDYIYNEKQPILNTIIES